MAVEFSDESMREMEEGMREILAGRGVVKTIEELQEGLKASLRAHGNWALLAEVEKEEAAQRAKDEAELVTA